MSIRVPTSTGRSAQRPALGVLGWMFAGWVTAEALWFGLHFWVLSLHLVAVFPLLWIVSAPRCTY